MKKTPYTFKLDDDLLEVLKKEAKKLHRSFNNYVESILKDRKK
jgi:hypothetical protein